jgi:hypothetical protein
MVNHINQVNTQHLAEVFSTIPCELTALSTGKAGGQRGKSKLSNLSVKDHSTEVLSISTQHSAAVFSISPCELTASSTGKARGNQDKSRLLNLFLKWASLSSQDLVMSATTSMAIMSFLLNLVMSAATTDCLQDQITTVTATTAEFVYLAMFAPMSAVITDFSQIPVMIAGISAAITRLLQDLAVSATIAGSPALFFNVMQIHRPMTKPPDEVHSNFQYSLPFRKRFLAQFKIQVPWKSLSDDISNLYFARHPFIAVLAYYTDYLCMFIFVLTARQRMGDTSPLRNREDDSQETQMVAFTGHITDTPHRGLS